MSDKHAITSEAELRAVVGAEVHGLAEKNIDYLNDFAVAYLARAPFMILATADAEGNLDASPKGDAPGFVEVLDKKTLLIPDRPGNKLAYGHLNVLANPRVGLIFMIPGTPETLRINGDAQLTADPEICERLAARGKPATLAMRVTVREAFFHCAKAFIRSGLWQPDSWPARHKVSFGEMYRAQRGAEVSAEAIDAAIAADYQENL